MTFQHGCPHHCIPPGGMYFLNTSNREEIVDNLPVNPSHVDKCRIVRNFCSYSWKSSLRQMLLLNLFTIHTCKYERYYRYCKLCLHDADCCYVTKWVTIMSALDVSHMEGYCLYTLSDCDCDREIFL